MGSKGNVKSVESDAGITFAHVQTNKSWPRGNRIAFAKEGIIMATPTVVRAGLFALAIVALGFVPGASGADSPSAKGKGDFMMNGNLRTFAFHAIKHHNGDVTGQAKVHNLASGTVVHMAIDCLSLVSTNTVLVSGTITDSNVSSLVGQTGVFEAQDSGKGTKDNVEGTNDNKAGSDSPPDRISLLIPFPADSTNCLSDISLETFPLDHGNIKVRP